MVCPKGDIPKVHRDAHREREKESQGCLRLESKLDVGNLSLDGEIISRNGAEDPLWVPRYTQLSSYLL